MEHKVIFAGEPEEGKQLVYAQIREAKWGDKIRVVFPDGRPARKVLESLIWCSALYGAVLDTISESELVFEVRRRQETTVRTIRVETEITESTFVQVDKMIRECEKGESLSIEFDQGLPDQKDLDFLAMNAFFSRGRLVIPTVEGNRLLLTVE